MTRPVGPAGSYRFSVPESVPVQSVVARIKAVDLDVGPNAEVVYRILDGDGLGTFRILTDPGTQEGLLTLLKVLVLLWSLGAGPDVHPWFLWYCPPKVLDRLTLGWQQRHSVY